MALVWLAGLVGLLRRDRSGAAAAPGWIFLVTFVFFLLTGGKAYYVVGAIAPLLAAGCVVLAQRARHVVVAGLVLALSAAVAWPAGLPMLPAATYAASFYPALDEDQLETIGWPELVGHGARAPWTRRRRRRRVHRELRRGRRAGVVRRRTRRSTAATTAGPTGGRRPTAPARSSWSATAPPDRDFTGCRSRHRSQVDGADNEEAGGKIWVCDGPPQAVVTAVADPVPPRRLRTRSRPTSAG